MVGQGMKYSSVSVCLINRIVDHELADLIELQKRVEEGTSIKIDYYRKYLPNELPQKFDLFLK